MEDNIKIIVDFLNFKLNNKDKQKLPFDTLCESTILDVLHESAKHSIAPIVADALINSDLLLSAEQTEICKHIVFNSLFSYQKQNYVLINLCDLFEKNKITHIPLKGSVLKSLYPEPWLRTSCDIDILIKPEDLQKATNLLNEKGYQYQYKSAHDILFVSENGVNVELHFDTIEKENSVGNSDDILTNIWNYASPKEKGRYEYILSEEMFIFYHIAHMAQHFLNGGCGMRPFIDIFVLRNIYGSDIIIKNELIKIGGLTKFAKAVNTLVDIWFSSKEYDEDMRSFEKYITVGGVYGNVENSIAIQQVKLGSKLKVILNRVFMRYDDLKVQYPIILKFKILFPFMQIFRWFRLIFDKETRIRSFKYYEKSQEIEKNSLNEIEKLIKFLNL